MNHVPKSPALSTPYTAILLYLLKFRFLHRVQFQSLFHHKHHHRVLEWLNYLTTNHYVIRYYDKTFAGEPAVYSLGAEGRKYLKSHPDVTRGVNILTLDRVWREKGSSEEFREHCLFLIDIYLSLVAFATKGNAQLHFSTSSDLYGMDYMLLPLADAYFALVKKNKTTKRYFLDVLPEREPRILRKRVRQYFYYYAHNYWQDHTEKPFPNIILVCPTKSLKNHLYYVIRGKLKDAPDLAFYLTTKDLIKEKGICRDVLDEVEVAE